jgi:hypothetical protein
MTEAKRRGRPPKAVPAPAPADENLNTWTVPPVVFSDARNAASMMPKPEAEQEIAAEARTQPGDASHITTQHAEEQIEQAQYDAPPHEQGHSRRRGAPAKIGELELQGLQAEAWQVYESQEDSIRFDTTGRRWRFYPDQTLTNEAIIVFEVRKGEDIREHRHSRAAYGTETAREQSDKIVADLAGAL